MNSSDYNPPFPVEPPSVETAPTKFSTRLPSLSNLLPILNFPAVLSWHSKYRPMSSMWVKRM
jgi:hypothetical protein